MKTQIRSLNTIYQELTFYSYLACNTLHDEIHLESNALKLNIMVVFDTKSLNSNSSWVEKIHLLKQVSQSTSIDGSNKPFFTFYYTLWLLYQTTNAENIQRELQNHMENTEEKRDQKSQSEVGIKECK